MFDLREKVVEKLNSKITTDKLIQTSNAIAYSCDGCSSNCSGSCGGAN